MTDPGLCGTCGNARVIRTRTGSRFFLCELSAALPAFPRYPRLPVLRCRGYEPAVGDEPETTLARGLPSERGGS